MEFNTNIKDYLVIVSFYVITIFTTLYFIPN